jgi:hypothetical protein
VLKGGAALLRGEEYHKYLKESLERIKSSCESLILQAKTSDMHRTRQLWNKVDEGAWFQSIPIFGEILRLIIITIFCPGYRELVAEQKKLNQDQQVVKGNTQEILEYQQREATKLNEVLGLLEGYQRNLDQQQKLLLQKDGKKTIVLNVYKMEKLIIMLKGKLMRSARRLHTLAVLPSTHWTLLVVRRRRSHSSLQLCR